MSKEGDATPKKGGRGKLLVLLLLALVLLIGGGATAYLLDLLPGRDRLGAAAAVPPEGGAGAAKMPPEEVVFVDLPDMLVNVNVTGQRLRFLKLVAALEVNGEPAAEAVRQLVPRITDNIHLYLRTLQPDDMSGAEGIYRIKRDLLARINQIVDPAEVRDVLIKEMLVQ